MTHQAVNHAHHQPRHRFNVVPFKRRVLLGKDPSFQIGKHGGYLLHAQLDADGIPGLSVKQEKLRLPAAAGFAGPDFLDQVVAAQLLHEIGDGSLVQACQLGHLRPGDRSVLTYRIENDGSVYFLDQSLVTGNIRHVYSSF